MLTTQVIVQNSHAGVCCLSSYQPQERAVALKPPSCPQSVPWAGRGPEAGGRQRPLHPQCEGPPEGLTGRGVTGQCCSTTGRALGISFHLHRAGREIVVTGGLPGHAGAVSVPALLKNTQTCCPTSDCNQLTTRTSGSHSNWEDVYSATSSPGCHTGMLTIFMFQCEKLNIPQKKQ